MINKKIYTIDEIKKILQENKDYFKERYFVEKFLLFGSYAKNQQTSDSDIDLLVSFTKPVDMFDFIDLQDYLIRLFDKKIDLGTLNSLKTFIKDRVLKEAIAL
ncbi:nucleotidyltransferase family protein [bacterium]|nr:nucleotidyltransferase family protein [bacterium]